MAEQTKRQNVYIYTRKIFNINDVQQNSDLIPKLFYNEPIYNLIDDPRNAKGLRILNTELNNIKESFRRLHPDKILNKINIYEYLLIEYESPNLIPVNVDYIYNDCIMSEIRKIINNSDNIEEIDLFITHLLRAHQDMRYGLYFSFKLAHNDDDFYRYALQEYSSNYDVIYFMEFGELLKYIQPIKDYYIRIYGTQFNSPLLYVNSGWDYGVINRNTILLGENGENYENIIEFYQRIVNKNFSLQGGELICQLPLPTYMFKHIFLQKNTGILPFAPEVLHGGYYKKYNKYKQKYLSLKQYL